LEFYKGNIADQKWGDPLLDVKSPYHENKKFIVIFREIFIFDSLDCDLSKYYLFKVLKLAWRQSLAKNSPKCKPTYPHLTMNRRQKNIKP
jgi:hypothetical protein